MRQLEYPEPVATTPTIKVAEVRTVDSAPTNLLGWLPILWSRVMFGGMLAEVEPWRWRPFAALFVLSGVLLYPCMSFYLFEPDEGRYAQIPREMLTAGNWIVPTLQGEAYLDKPPLFYWLVMLSYSLFGNSDIAARLVSSLAVHLTILATYLLGRRMLGDRAAFWGALLLAVSPVFPGTGRLLVLDGLLTLWVTLAILAVYLAQCTPQTPRENRPAERDDHIHRGWWLLAAVCCGLGVLTKGPVAVVLVLTPLLIHRRLAVSTVPISWRAWAAFFGIVLAINLPWYAAVCWQRPEFARYFLWRHNVQRFVEPFDHVRPVWFYLPILAGGLLPMTLLAWPVGRFLLSTQPAETSQRCPVMGYLALAGVCCAGFFSLAGSKLPTYILPAFPPLCLVIGCFIARTDWHKSRWIVGLVVAAWLVQAISHSLIIPNHARNNSPMQDFDVMRERCGDKSVPVVCFPRNVDSVAFYVERSDFRTFRSRELENLIHVLDQQPRTLILFGHRHSPDLLQRHLPKHLEMIDRRPMGECESAIVIHRVNAPSAVK